MSKVSLNFMPNRTYPELKRESLKVSFLERNIIQKRVPRIIEKIRDNIGITLISPTNKFVANVDPQRIQDMGFLTDFISRKIHELRLESKCDDEEISAIVYGGSAYDENRTDSDLSCRLVDAIEEGCELEEVNPTIITGQYLDINDSGLNSYVGQNQITFWGNIINKIKLGENATPAEIKKVLEELFEYVKISDVELKISEKFPDKTEHLARLQKK